MNSHLKYRQTQCISKITVNLKQKYPNADINSHLKYRHKMYKCTHNFLRNTVEYVDT